MGVKLRRAAAALAAAMIVLTLSGPTPAEGDTGTLTATCQLGGAPHPPPPATSSYAYAVTMPATVAPGEHFEVAVSVNYAVDAASDYGSVVLSVDGASPDVAIPDSTSTTLVTAPGTGTISGRVGLTAGPTPGTSVRVGVRSFGQQVTIGSAVVTHGCRVPSAVHARAHVAGPGAAPDPTVSIGDATVSEGTAGALRMVTVPVTLSSPSATPVSVDLRVTGGTAVPGTPPGGDFKTQPAVRTVRFTPLHSGFTPVFKQIAIGVTPDAVGEGDETIELGLSNVVGPYAIRDGRGVVTILDDEGLVGPAGAVGDVAITEGTSGSRRPTVPVTLNQPVGETVIARVDLFSRSANCIGFRGSTPPAGVDCRARRTTVAVRFPPGQVSKRVGQQVFADGTVEFDEIVGVSLQSIGPENSSSSTIVGRSRVLGSIMLVDDD